MRGIMDSRRISDDTIVITGIGVVSGFGIGYDALCAGLVAEKSCVRRLDGDGANRCRVRKGAFLEGFNPSDYEDTTHFGRLARGTQFSIMATDEAIKQACVPRALASDSQVGLVFASTRVALEKTQQFYGKILDKGPRLVNPLVFQETVNNAPASHICMRHGITGPSLTLTSGGTGGIQALAIASQWLGRGKVKSVVVTAADVADAPSQSAHGHARGHAPVELGGIEESCPFDRRRNGYVLGEAAVSLVLETWASARDRGVDPRVTLCGWGMAHDGCGPGRYHHDGLGMEASIRAAMEMASKGCGNIGWVLAGAQSSKVGDRSEARALRRVFSDRTPPVTALKSAVGKVESASAPLFIAAAVAGMRNEVLFPTLNHEEHDPDCELDLVKSTRRAYVDTVLANALWFGGGSASVVVQRWDDGCARGPSTTNAECSA